LKRRQTDRLCLFFGSAVRETACVDARVCHLLMILRIGLMSK
jgi:hypothetical protein